MATIEEVNAQLLFTNCKYSQEIKLNVEWQMNLLSKKVNTNFMDGIASIAALH